MTEIQLAPLEVSDRERFIKDDHFEKDGGMISHDTIARAIDEGSAYRIVKDGRPVGGVVIRTEYDHGELELLFVSPDVHSKGIGYAAWCAVEAMHPEVTVWETITPCSEKRIIRFYVDRCGFHIVEFCHAHHAAPHDKDVEHAEMFRFEKLLPVTPESIREQIKRIGYYEKIMRQAESGDRGLLQELSDYYVSPAWKRDFAADEAGRLPKKLERGVLSEDGIYTLLEKYGE